MSAEYIKQVDACVDQFNLIVKKMVIRIAESNSDDHEVYRLRQRFFLAMSFDELLAVKKIGPTLWNHREQIKERNVDHFMNYQYDGFILKTENKELINYIVEVIKQDYMKLNKEEQDDMYENIKQLLIIYTKYLKLQKQ